MFLVYGENSGEMPFQRDVVAYLAAHEGEGKTLGDCAAALRLGPHLVEMVLDHLVETGQAAYGDEGGAADA